MEWMIPVNDMLCDKITKLNSTLIPPGFHGDVRGVRIMQESLSKVIDILGEQSATAQGLNRVITTAEKLRNSPTHILYLLKDAKAKGGKGEVIALLKVGRKHLFLFDEKDKVCEVEPLCVLDFFVLRDRQRHGYGKLLFDHMLQDMEVSAQELAIDGPSPKMEQFLKKNYNVERLLRQNNNFAVSPQFFGAVPEMNNKSGRSTPAVTPQVGRFAAPKPPSAIANVIHGGASACQETSNGFSPSDGVSPEVTEVEPVAENVPEPVPKEVEADLADNQKSPERPCTLQVEPVLEASPSAALSPAGSTTSRRDSQLTDRGYFDVKFYHNKLW
ncbi:unnamed protein product [Danaus chrysippus]|uniref:Alpha-tubulin N-acetyltransferase n=1 Tax=Danaus chrysippus TaxID=151541 RepID=A0A8J2Q5M0_9NEOP|nr:unnamed protein product [Danaus chrysippus]